MENFIELIAKDKNVNGQNIYSNTNTIGGIIKTFRETAGKVETISRSTETDRMCKEGTF